MGKGGKKERRRRQAVEEAEQQQQNNGAEEVVKRSKAESVQPRGKKVYASADGVPARGKRARDAQLVPAGKDSPRQKRSKVDKEVCSASKDSSNKTVLTSLETDQNECPSETSDCGQTENAPAEVAVVAPRERNKRVGRRSSAGTANAKTAAGADLIKSPMAIAKYVAEQVGSDSEVNGDEPAQYAKFVGSPISKAKAKARWPHRYESKDKVLNDASNRLNREAAADDRQDVDCVAHYSKAEVDGSLFELDDNVEINNEGGKNFIGKIVEMFEKRDGSPWITAQWFFFVEDTALGDDGKDAKRHDPKRLFFSEVQDPNPLDCLVKKVSVTRVHPTVQLNKDILLKHTDYVYDMGYTTGYSTFYSLPGDDSGATTSQESSGGPRSESSKSSQDKKNSEGSELSLLDLYAGCGAMSTGLCSGARLAGHKLISRWAVDINQEACESYKYNHPETEVRNEQADDFFALIKEWQQLCAKYPLGTTAEKKPQQPKADDQEVSDDDSEELADEVFEVEKLLAVKYEESKGLLFKVRWKSYGEDEDTWEPLGNLEDCPERLEEFVVEGRKNKLLPLPGEVDVICGGPPCQGASGFNRFRNYTNPLADPRNHQMVVYMDIVDFLKPRFILMENVVDILKFCGGVLGKYALSRLVSMHYQAKIGILVAGSYGLPQFRMRVFLWGASTMEKLPAFPLPTHDAVNRGHVPVNWEQNLVSIDEDEKHRLEKALVLEDAISDLPPISNYEKRDERAYEKPPQTPFQKLVRMPKGPEKPILYDHKSLIMNKDDYDRACQIPKRKGANFRDLEGVIVHDDKTVAVVQKNRKMLASGKPLVPDYAITFVGGKSCKPFGRLWWDETVSTVVTRAEPHNQAVLHPSQDRVLSIRENARLQGFPDHYKLFGDTKEKYKQVGNAVAVPVARALGYALGKALSDDVSGADFLLPQGFPMSLIDAKGPVSYSLDLPQNVKGADFQLPESMFASKELTLPQDVPGADFQLPDSMFAAKDSDSS